MHRPTSLAALLLFSLLPATARADAACLPCAGLVTADPVTAAELLPPKDTEQGRAPIFVGWTAGAADDPAEPLAALSAAGATPWLRVPFAAPPPLRANLPALEEELRRLAGWAAALPPGARVQLDWVGAGKAAEPAEYAFLIKRAAVAVTGAQPDARVVAGPFETDTEWIRALFAEEVAAYLDGLAVGPAAPDGVRAVASALQELDPGIELAVTGLSRPEQPMMVLVAAARYAAAGAAVSMFELDRLDSATVAPFPLLASEFHGDLALDPYSRPDGAAEAWSFVRGEDLGLRVVARAAAAGERLRLLFPDTQIREPKRIDPDTGEAVTLYGLRSSTGYELEIEETPEVVLLSLERIGAAEVAGMLGVEEELTVEDVRQIPVGEILRRLQAFEDAQARRLSHYRALNTTHLRFQAGTGAGTFEATFRGDFFLRQGGAFDWAWKELYFNGVRWRSRKIPEIPLIQPEKAAALPIEISFTRDYRYSLRGTATVNGRDCWVVDFQPTVTPDEGRTLFQGTVWVDRQIFARVQTRAVQLGLKGQVVSNEETVTFEPLDAAGEAAPWSEESYLLPTRLTGQQIWSLLSVTTVVEREIVLSEIEINGSDFEAQREAVLASDVTMVRDTDDGLRYLEVDKQSGERVVKEELDPKRRFLVGGVFYDESQDFPIPLAGINWLWFDWRGTGAQANVFFAGPLFNVAITDPDFRGSRWDAGLDVFALAIAGTDTLTRDGREAVEEDVEFVRPNIDFKLGRPLGSFAKLELQYELGWLNFSRADDTAADFALPSDTLTHRFTLVGRYNRAGYRFRLGGSRVLRDEWEPWGFAGNPDYDPGKDEYSLWEVGIGKTWHLPNFLQFGAELEYVSGSNLDRFSKYEFGIFSDVRVHGYQSDKIRAEEALGLHLNYGFDLGGVIRLDLVGDAAWATDEATALEEELLAGIGLVGTLVGPWQTLLRLDIGAAVAGPDDGFAALFTVLKLFGS